MPTKSQQSVSSSTTNDTNKSSNKPLTQIDASLIATTETNTITPANTTASVADDRITTIIEPDDGCDTTVAAFFHPYDIKVIETNIDAKNETSNASTDDHKNRKPLNLKLNVIVTDTDEPNPENTNKTKKKFYESDDTFINAIFSQTITSTTVTPTDEELSYTFDPPDLQLPTETSGTNVPSERIECDSDIETDLDLDDDGEYADGRPLTNTNTDWITVEEATHPDLSSYNESNTENLDNYNETMISFTDTICLDHDQDDIEADQMNINETTAAIPDEANAYETIYVNDKQRFSIVIDCFDDSEALSTCCYVEPTTPISEADANVAATVAAVASYFDQTIDDDADDGFVTIERNRSFEGNGSQDEDEDEDDDDEDDEDVDDESDTESIGNGIDRNHCVGVHVSVAFNTYNKDFYISIFIEDS